MLLVRVTSRRVGPGLVSLGILWHGYWGWGSDGMNGRFAVRVVLESERFCVVGIRDIRARRLV